MPDQPYTPALEEALEDGIIAALDPLKPTFEVAYFADVDSDYKDAFIKPRVSVMVHSCKGGDQLDTNIALSDEDVMVQMCLESRSRRGSGGIYDLKRKVKDIVNGLKMDNWERLLYGEFKYSERTAKGVWTYNLLFTTKQVNQQVFDDGYPKFPLQIGPQ